MSSPARLDAMTSTSCFSIARALKKKFMFCYCNIIYNFMSEGRSTSVLISVLLYHTGQCKSTGGYLQRPGVGFFRTGAGQNAIHVPTVIIMFV